MASFNFVPTWAKFWLLLSTIICIIDASFVLLRPRTLPGGDLHKYFSPYALYIEVDKLYGDLKDEFVVHQSILNYYECFINVVALILLASKGNKQQLSGAFLTIVVNAFTFWKTILYFQYGIPHSLPIANLSSWFFLYIVPSSFWVLVPLAGIISVSKRISNTVLANLPSTPGKEKLKQS